MGRRRKREKPVSFNATFSNPLRTTVCGTWVVGKSTITKNMPEKPLDLFRRSHNRPLNQPRIIEDALSQFQKSENVLKNNVKFGIKSTVNPPRTKMNNK